jgi:hypothetical protein
MLRNIGTTQVAISPITIPVLSLCSTCSPADRLLYTGLHGGSNKKPRLPLAHYQSQSTSEHQHPTIDSFRVTKSNYYHDVLATAGDPTRLPIIGPYAASYRHTLTSFMTPNDPDKWSRPPKPLPLHEKTTLISFECGLPPIDFSNPDEVKKYKQNIARKPRMVKGRLLVTDHNSKIQQHRLLAHQKPTENQVEDMKPFLLPDGFPESLLESTQTSNNKTVSTYSESTSALLAIASSLRKGRLNQTDLLKIGPGGEFCHRSGDTSDNSNRKKSEDKPPRLKHTDPRYRWKLAIRYVMDSLLQNHHVVGNIDHRSLKAGLLAKGLNMKSELARAKKRFLKYMEALNIMHKSDKSEADMMYLDSILRQLPMFSKFTQVTYFFFLFFFFVKRCVAFPCT